MKRLGLTTGIEKIQNLDPLYTSFFVAILYGTLAILYIILSSYFVGLWAESAAQQAQMETHKGVAFVCVTMVLLFCISYQLLNKVAFSQKKILQQQGQMLILEKYRMISLTSAIVGHDINNALAIATISLNLMKEKCQDAKNSKDLELEGGLRKALSKVGELTRTLTFNPQKTSPHEVNEVDLNELILSAVDLAKKHPSAMNCTISFSPHNADAGKIKIREQILEQAIINMLLNAAVATQKIGTIEISLHVEKSSLKISVEDDGPGIAEGKTKEIFEPFYTTKPDGTGLGLLSVQMCAEAHQGTVTVKKSHLGGALFELTLNEPLPKLGCV